MMMECCQITFLILLCLLIGFFLGVWATGPMEISGIEQFWQKFTDQFKKSTA